MLDDATLAEYLDRLGWERSPHGEGTLRAVRDTPQGDVAVYLRLSSDWLIASVVPFLVTGGDNNFDLARWLLRMNRDMAMTKFAYDDDGDVVLTVEVPTESLDYEEVCAALTGLVEHTVMHRATLRAASDSATTGSS
ncbi:MAG: YbjN domain-containing protein [Polyangiales bacterium]|nr:YbjN domain-containing protein [Myxococcales bacterium]MCB9657652.1 YbjN domain-containing protein [Sandaracinaceae bacterium]